MFEVLDRVDLEVAEEALYHVGLRLYERRYFPEWRHWLPLRTSGEVGERLLEELRRDYGDLSRRAA